jgi:hypothetical protein
LGNKPCVRSVNIKYCCRAVWNTHARLARHFKRNGKTTRGGILNDVYFFCGRANNVTRRADCADKVQRHIARLIERSVRRGERCVAYIANGYGFIAANGLLKKAAKIGVCGGAPCALLFASSDEFKAKVS